MKSKVSKLTPDELLESYITFGAKKYKIFKQNHELFYISSLSALTEISNPPLPPIKSFSHSLLFLTTGTLVMKVGFQQVKVYKDECLVVPAGKVFSYSLEDFENSKLGDGFLVGFNDDFLIGQIGSREVLKSFEFLSIWGNPIIKLNPKPASYFLQSCTRLMEEYEQFGLKNKLVVQAYLLAALCDLNINYKPLSNHANKAAVELTNRFKELLHLTINVEHKVSGYAARLSVSPNHLNKSVKLITEKSPSTWIRETLINEAKVLLFQSDLTIQEIVRELGMDDPSYFSRVFKKQEGMTPVEYRRLIESS